MKKLPFFFLLFASVVFASDPMPPSNWATHNNSKVHYYDIGNKKSASALVFVHGWACTAGFWKENFRAFPKTRVIAIDLPGHGKSDSPKTSYSMDYFADAVNTVMKTANVERAVLAGHSMGTPVVRQFYRRNPDKTIALIVVDGALRPYGPPSAMEQFMKPFYDKYDDAVEAFVGAMVVPMKDNQDKVFVKQAMKATPKHVGLSAFEGMVDESIWKEDKIDVPLLAILAKSPAWQPDTEQFVKGLAPNSQFQMWEGVSHFLMLDEPARFNKTVNEFLNNNKLL